MMRLLETHRVVRFYRNIPIATAQLVPEIAVSAPQQNAAEVVRGIENFPDDLWRSFVANRRRRVSHAGRGSYRAERQRRARAAGQPDDES